MALEAGERARPSARDDRVCAEQVRDLYRNTPIGVGSALVGVALLSWLLLDLDPGVGGRLALWLALTAGTAAWQLGLCLLYWRARPAEARWPVWARRFTAASLAEGARWGLGAVWLAGPGRVDEQLWILLVVASASAGSASSLGSYTPAFYALLFPAVAPFVVTHVFDADPIQALSGLLVTVFMVSVALLGRGQGRRLSEALRLRFENLDLARDLERQKALADAANRAKTRFLASASHDLRQPMHALSLFVEALRRHPLPAVTAELVEQVSDTAGAMEGLFDSLLDISQLDAGVLRAQPVAFPIQPLLARLCREQEAELAGRPVALRLVASSAVVRTDPALLERVLRNLLSNAVRYTPSGRIVVGCRRGARLRVCVLDTGVGIPAEAQAEVFEEFHQLANPQRNRAHGLGLGLSISRRIAALLNCPLTLASTVGRGTAVAIALPLVPAGALAEEAAGVKAAGLATPGLASGLLCVVDDDDAVRRGAETLLRGWGYAVVGAASGAEAQAALDREGRAPDLLICDWRLAGGEDGRAVAERLRARYGPSLPVMILTGDVTAGTDGSPGWEGVGGTGVLVMHKPLSGGRLRAALGAALRGRGEAVAAV